MTVLEDKLNAAKENRNNDVRTFFPLDMGYHCRRIEHKFFSDALYTFREHKAEVLQWNKSTQYSYYAASITGESEATFANMPNLRCIDSINAAGGGLKLNSFVNCPKLEFFRIINLKNNLSLAESPLLDKDCVFYLIEKSIPTSAITITLHPDAYARLVDDIDIVAALEAQPLVSLVSA